MLYEVGEVETDEIEPRVSLYPLIKHKHVNQKMKESNVGTYLRKNAGLRVAL